MNHKAENDPSPRPSPPWQGSGGSQASFREEGTMHGSPAFKVRGKLLACAAIHKSAEPDTLAVRIPFDLRAELMESDPQSYYLTDHYVNYPVVLVRLSRIGVEGLRELLGASWRFVSAKRPKIKA